jgi:hypothetical protein
VIWRNDDNDRPPIPPRAALLLLIWLAGLLWLLVACSPHMAAQTLPEVRVQVIAGGGGFQLERWDYGVYRDDQEAFCRDVHCVNAYLQRVGNEFTYSVDWMEVDG